MYDNLTYAMIVALSAGTSAGYLGTLMVSRHMALVGDALSHVALPGLALGLVFDFNPFIGAFAFVALVMVITWHIERTTSLSVEAIVGVLFVLALAIGVLITPEPELLHALFGDVSSVTWVDAVLTLALSFIVILVTRRIYNDMALTMISREIAVSKGVQVARINLIFLILVATVVSIGIKEVGTLLVGAVVIVPAAASRTVSTTMKMYTVTSALIGAFSAFVGVFASQFIAVPAGPLVVITGAAVFVVAVAIYHFTRSGRKRSGTESGGAPP